MDDQAFGTRDKRGHWSPDAPLRVGPLLDTPWSAARVIRWLPSYFLPWNMLFMGLASAFWFLMTPDRDTLADLRPGWALWIFARNAALILLVYGGLELRLYVRRR